MHNSLPSRLFLAASATLAAAAFLVSASSEAKPELAHSETHSFDWTFWRGPMGDGSSTETGLIESWDPETGENLLWKRDDIYSRSTPVVMDGKLYILARANEGQDDEGERVLCLDAATGEDVWQAKFNVYLSEVPDTRVSWSAVVADPETNTVFAQGVCGTFLCLDADTGAIKWQHALHEEFGAISTYGGRTNFPIVFEDLVIASAVVTGWADMGRPAHRFMAFDKKTGEMRWFNGTRLIPADTTYSTPFLTVLNGQDAMVFGSGDGQIWAMQPRTGKPLWNYQITPRGVNTSPIVVDGITYVGQSEENIDDNTMGCMVALDANGKEIWRVKEVMIGKSSPIMIDGYLYCIDDGGGLFVLDPETGDQINTELLKLGSVMRGSPLYADGKLYVGEANGNWWILRPNPDEPTGVEGVHGDADPSRPKPGLRLRTEIHGSPIVSAGRIYLPTTSGLYCLGNEDNEPAAGPLPSRPVSKPAGADAKPAQVQVVPVEVALKPGQSQEFRVRVYNAAGAFLDEIEVELTADGGGTISGNTFTADAAPNQQAAIITAKVGELAGKARVRILPDLPWSFDFSDGRVPITWIGMKYRHEALDFNLLTGLKEKDPLAQKLYIYLSARFNDAGVPKMKIDNGTPYQAWSALVDNLSLRGSVGTLEDAKAKLSPALDLLVKEGVLKSYQWLADEAQKIQLVVEKGPHTAGGNGVLAKLEKIPVPRGFTKLGCLSQGFIGPADFHDYTVEADFYGSEPSPGIMPDMGLICQGYSLLLKGKEPQALDIRQWAPQDRMAVRKTAESGEKLWKPYVWYRLKLKATNLGENRVKMEGKFWPRDEAEPKEWMVSVTDPAGTSHGAPGFYGNSREAEYYIDNVVVTKNE